MEVLDFPHLHQVQGELQGDKEYIGSSVVNETSNRHINILEDEMSKLLMKNFKIQEYEPAYNFCNMVIKLSKGHVGCRSKMNGTNLTRFYLVDLDKQRRIIPTQLYLYLRYEDKYCRFCAKYIYFKDKNYFPEGKKVELETKVVKYVKPYQELFCGMRNWLFRRNTQKTTSTTRRRISRIYVY